MYSANSGVHTVLCRVVCDWDGCALKGDAYGSGQVVDGRIVRYSEYKHDLVRNFDGKGFWKWKAS